jgi:hypothetical protein
MAEQLGEALIRRVHEVAADSRRMGRALAARGEVARRRRLVARSVNIIVGALAAVVSLAPPVTELLGSFGVRAIGSIAAIVLILDGVMPLFVGDDSYERLSEYSMYIYSYAGQLLNTLADEGMRVEVRRARLMEGLAMATRNMDDVRSKWPWVDDLVEVKHSARPSTVPMHQQALE